MSFNFLGLLRSREPEKPLGGRYKIIRQLSAGGFGHTFLAEDIHLPNHPQCVLKQLKPQFKDAEQLQIARRLFNTEAEVLYQLGNHDQIPRLLAHFEESREFYLAQELIVGDALDQLLIEGNQWTQPAVVALLKDILEVLAFVHQQGVIHRDIKPSNLIRRQRDGRIVLIDFGAVKQVSAATFDARTGQTSLTIAIGTQGYMPDEQLAGNPRFSSDVYAVGMVGIQALTGINPRRLTKDPRTSELLWQQPGVSDRPKLSSEISPELAAILTRMVRYDFRERYSTAAEALEALQGLPSNLLDFQTLTPDNSEIADLPTAKFTPEVPAATPTPPQATLASPLQVEQSGSQVQLEQPGSSGEETLAIPGVASPGPSNEGAALARSVPEKATEVIGTHLRSLLSTATVVLPQIAHRSLTKPWLLLGGVTVLGLSILFVKSLFPSKPVPPVTATNPSENSAPSTPSPETQVSELLKQAKQLQEARQPQKALALYNETLAINPKNAEAQWGRCYNLNRLQQLKEAMAACDKALALRPNYPEALWSKGYILDQQKRYSESLALYERAIALKPDFAEAWSNKGTALLLLDRPAEAVTAFDQALKLKPNLAESWNNRGAALWRLQQFDTAIASIDKALQLQPNYPDARSLREQMRQRLGR